VEGVAWALRGVRPRPGTAGGQCRGPPWGHGGQSSGIPGQCWLRAAGPGPEAAGSCLPAPAPHSWLPRAGLPEEGLFWENQPCWEWQMLLGEPWPEVGSASWERLRARVCTCVFAGCFTERLSEFSQEAGRSLTLVAPFSELRRGKWVFSLLLIKNCYDAEPEMRAK